MSLDPILVQLPESEVFLYYLKKKNFFFVINKYMNRFMSTFFMQYVRVLCAAVVVAIASAVALLLYPEVEITKLFHRVWG